MPVRNAGEREPQQQLRPFARIDAHVVREWRVRHAPAGEVRLHFGYLVRIQRRREQRHARIARRVHAETEGRNQHNGGKQQAGLETYRKPRETRAYAPDGIHRLNLHPQDRLQSLRYP